MNRREFFADVGTGMLAAGLGAGGLEQIGGSVAFADQGPAALAFGSREPLVNLMIETPAAKLLPMLTERLKNGTELKEIVAAAALANARTFGGEDYIGFHTMMALSPAFRMASQMSKEKQALPVFKVLYRNTSRLQAFGGRSKEVLKPVEAGDASGGGDALREAVRKKDMATAERTFAASAAGKPEDAFNDLLTMVEDGHDVHRVVMPYRAWDLLDIVGAEHAHTLLRQSVHYCVKQENPRMVGYAAESRALLPKLLEQHKLLGATAGTKAGDDAWVEKLSLAIFKGPPSQAAGAVAEALAEGFDPIVIGEAISLAANQLILRDIGRTKDDVQNDKPVGSVHGDSIGVHACDSANAWRNMSRLGNARNRAACLILGAYQVAVDGTGHRREFHTWMPHPHGEHVEKLAGKNPEELLAALNVAIRAKNQAAAAAAAHLYAETAKSASAAFELMLQYAVSEEGALHAEKYFRTTFEEYAITRSKFRSRQLVGLARVTASEFGKPAAGYVESCKLLGA